MPEEDIHLLFDMALKSGSDIPRAQDPRLVLEVALLRMASAPKMVSLQNLLQNPALATSHSAGGARQPYSPPVSPPVKGHNRLNEAAKVAEVPTGLEAMKAALDNKPKAKPAPEVKAAPAPEVKPPQKATGATATEKWIHFVELVRQDDALFAAKIENMLFAKEEGKLLSLGVPVKLGFLKEQMSDTQVRKKLQGFIDSYWGAGYSFEVLMSRDQVGESAQSLNQKKVQLAEDEIRNKITENEMVKAAQKAFNGQIKSIIEIKPRAK
ncbi:DNA polymerase III subunits gamma and tau [compost metagenome]